MRLNQTVLDVLSVEHLLKKQKIEKTKALKDLNKAFDVLADNFSVSSDVPVHRKVKVIGAPGGNRTHNLLIKSQLLYQLSYRHKSTTLSNGRWHELSQPPNLRFKAPWQEVW